MISVNDFLKNSLAEFRSRSRYDFYEIVGHNGLLFKFYSYFIGNKKYRQLIREDDDLLIDKDLTHKDIVFLRATRLECEDRLKLNYEYIQSKLDEIYTTTLYDWMPFKLFRIGDPLHDGMVRELEHSINNHLLSIFSSLDFGYDRQSIVKGVEKEIRAHYYKNEHPENLFLIGIDKTNNIPSYHYTRHPLNVYESGDPNIIWFDFDVLISDFLKDLIGEIDLVVSQSVDTYVDYIEVQQALTRSEFSDLLITLNKHTPRPGRPMDPSAPQENIERKVLELAQMEVFQDQNGDPKPTPIRDEIVRSHPELMGQLQERQLFDRVKLALRENGLSS